MEWVETTAKSIEAAQEAALDQLGVGADEAEFEVIEEPRPGLFGRVRGEARLRARVRPATVRPKQERRRKGRSDKSSKATTAKSSDSKAAVSDPAASEQDAPAKSSRPASSTKQKNSQQKNSQQSKEQRMSNDDRPESTVTPDEVGAAAVTFMDGLTDAFGLDGSSVLQVDGLELELNVEGSELGLLVGPGGRTLNAVQDLARVAALGKFARDVAKQVRTTGTERSLEAISSSDRKVIHDALKEEDGVSSRSVGEDPDRRIVVDPA